MRKEKKMFKFIQSCEESNVFYLETIGGIRAIIRDGEYDGWYSPILDEVV